MCAWFTDVSIFACYDNVSSSRWLSQWHESVDFCGTVESRSWFSSHLNESARVAPIKRKTFRKRLVTTRRHLNERISLISLGVTTDNVVCMSLISSSSSLMQWKSFPWRGKIEMIFRTRCALLEKRQMKLEIELEADSSRKSNPIHQRRERKSDDDKSYAKLSQWHARVGSALPANAITDLYHLNWSRTTNFRNCFDARFSEAIKPQFIITVRVAIRLRESHQCIIATQLHFAEANHETEGSNVSSEFAYSWNWFHKCLWSMLHLIDGIHATIPACGAGKVVIA